MSRHIHLWFRDAYDPSEPRDPSGKWTEGGGGRSTKTSHLTAAPANRAQWPRHIKKLAIPPAWTAVRISSDPRAPLQATGTDAKGRTQYMYSDRHKKSQSAAKFRRIKALEKRFDLVTRRLERDMKGRDRVNREHAQVAHLILDMGLRPGSEADRGDVQTYGATTLKGSHVKDNGKRLEFIGKMGVPLDLPVDNPVLAQTLAERARQAGADGQLFPNVSDASLRAYVRKIAGADFKTKDFRTLKGTKLANQLVEAAPVPTSKSAYKKAVRDVAEKVAKKLGNTAAIALQSYISPLIFAPWQGALA